MKLLLVHIYRLAKKILFDWRLLRHRAAGINWHGPCATKIIGQAGERAECIPDGTNTYHEHEFDGNE